MTNTQSSSLLLVYIVLKSVTRKGKIAGEPVLIISLLIESWPLAFLFFNCAIPLDTLSAEKGESSVKFSLTNLGFGAFCNLF